MDTTTATVDETPAYETPVVLDAGDVVEVTLGTAKFDSADDTQYRV